VKLGVESASVDKKAWRDGKETYIFYRESFVFNTNHNLYYAV